MDRQTSCAAPARSKRRPRATARAQRSASSELPLFREVANPFHGVEVGGAIRLPAQLQRLGGKLIAGSSASRSAYLIIEFIDKAKVELVGLRLLDPNREPARWPGSTRLSLDLRFPHRCQIHAIAHAKAAEVECARERDARPFFGARAHGKTFQSEHELQRLLGAQHQAAPELLTRKLVEQGHKRVVDLYQVLESHDRGVTAIVAAKKPGLRAARAVADRSARVRSSRSENLGSNEGATRATRLRSSVRSSSALCRPIAPAAPTGRAQFAGRATTAADAPFMFRRAVAEITGMCFALDQIDQCRATEIVRKLPGLRLVAPHQRCRND